MRNIDPNERITVLKFVKSAPPYHAGERAGFNAETADLYIKAGFAVADQVGVPRVDPKIQITDMQRRLEEGRAMLAAAERRHRELKAEPAKEMEADELMAHMTLLRTSIEADASRLAGAGAVTESNGGGRRPNASQRAG